MPKIVITGFLAATLCNPKQKLALPCIYPLRSYYATLVSQNCPNTKLEFYTRNLVNGDWNAEKITYQAVSGGVDSCGLKRWIGDSYLDAKIMAGSLQSDVIDISVCKMSPPAENGFEVKYFKADGNDVLSTDPSTLVDSVQIRMQVFNPKNGQTAALFSRVKLRNK